MLDSEHRLAPASPVSFKAVEYLTIQLSTLADGAVFVSVTAVTVDDEEPQLLTQEIATERTATIEHALTLIADRVRGTMLPPTVPAPEEPAPTFRNHYRCARCGHEWDRRLVGHVRRRLP